MTDFEEIYKAYFNDVLLYIRRLSKDEHIAEEITSETFFKAMRDIDSFRGECHIRVWLCQIAKNCYYSYLKKAEKVDKSHDIELFDIPDSSATVEERIVQTDEARRVQEILHDIQDTYKEVFMWRVFAELSFKEIGQIFHKSENWACVTYHRAKNMIKDRLEDNKHEE